MAHLQLEDVSFRWPGGRGFDGIHMNVEQGEFVLLTGPSGEGKSTLLRLLVRFEEPQRGRILYQGTLLREWMPEHLRRGMALVQQTPVMGGVTVRDALCLPFTFAANVGLPSPSDMILRERLEAVQLGDMALTAAADSLSLGQKQRVALARALLLNPATLLLDEPTSALDAQSRKAVEAQVEAANAAGATIIMITHTEYRPPCAARKFILRGGQLHEEAQNDHSLSDH